MRLRARAPSQVQCRWCIAGIGIGCLLWWVILTYIVKKLSVRFGMKSLEWINRIVALVLIILALVGIYTSLFE